MIATPCWKTAAGHRRRWPTDTRPDITDFLIELAGRIHHSAPENFAATPARSVYGVSRFATSIPTATASIWRGPSTSTCTSADEL
ncbi:hypothetical protein [Amycolatopsis mediterranei]|uniref:hypothetical protein n=1 Tax=Amycolatopsis mediterranei TaxID=33910 RepID=UPI000AB4BA5D|nr:hypothetical protein [Amycolatopsis mediterranei]